MKFRERHFWMAVCVIAALALSWLVVEFAIKSGRPMTHMPDMRSR